MSELIQTCNTTDCSSQLPTDAYLKHNAKSCDDFVCPSGFSKKGTNCERNGNCGIGETKQTDTTTKTRDCQPCTSKPLR